MTKKKMSARVFTFFTAMAMMFSIVLQSMPAVFATWMDDVEYANDLLELTVKTADGTELKSDGDNPPLKQGDELSVALSLTLLSTWHTNGAELPIEFSYPLNCVGLETANSKHFALFSEELNRSVGEFWIQDGSVYFSINNEDFINEDNRKLNVSFSATVNVEGNEEGGEVETDIRIADKEFHVTVDLGDCDLNGTKVASGKARYDANSGKIIQEYTLTFTADTATVYNAEITDHMGEWLSIPANVNSVTVDGKDMPFSQNGNDFTYSLPSPLEVGRTVTVTYELCVDEDIWSGSTDPKGQNTFSMEWENKGGKKIEKNPTDSPSPNLTPPSISKSGAFNADGTKVVWTIILDTGLYGDDLSIEKFLDMFDIFDYPSSVKDYVYDQFVKIDDSSSFKKIDTGKYEYTLELELTDEVIDSLKDLTQSVNVSNHIVLKYDDTQISENWASATREGIGILDKEAVGELEDARKSGVFEWKSVVNIPNDTKAPVSDVVITDIASGNNHSLDLDSLKINGKSATDLEKEGKITFDSNDGTFTIRFTDSYLKELLQNAGTAAFAEVILTYSTKAEDPDDLEDSFAFLNDINVKFKYPNAENGEVDVDAFADYTYTVLPKEYFSKQCNNYDRDILWWSDYSDYTNPIVGSYGDYSIPLLVTIDELKNGDTFTIKDSTSEGMGIAKDTERVYVVSSTNDTTSALVLPQDIFEAMQSCLVRKDNSDGTYTFTFTVDDDILDAIKTSMADKYVNPENYCFAIAYYASIDDPTVAGTYQNSVEGDFNGHTGTPVDTMKWFNAVDMIKKGYKYDDDNAFLPNGAQDGKINMLFEVDINPRAATLNNGEPIKAIDEMSSDLTLIIGTITLTDILTGEELVRGVDYYVTVDIDETTGETTTTYTLPDSKALHLSYMAAIDGKVGDPINSVNIIRLEAGDKTFNAAPCYGGGFIIAAAGGASSGQLSATIEKISSTGASLKGARFELYRMKTDANGDLVIDVDVSNNINYDNDPTIKLTNLVRDVIYMVREVDAPDGYVVDDTPYYFLYPDQQGMTFPAGFTGKIIDFQNNANYYPFVNDPQSTDEVSLKFIKTWSGDDAALGDVRPESITVKVVGFVEALEKEIKLDLKYESIEIKASDNWTKTIKNLPKYYEENGTKYEITYTVEEMSVTGYKSPSDIKITKNNGVYTASMTNTFKNELKDIEITKKWVGDAANKDSRPDEITVNVVGTVDGDTVYTSDAIIISSKDNWKLSVTGLQKYYYSKSSDGKITEKSIDYSVVEKTNVPGYTSKGGSKSDYEAAKDVDGYTITNSYITDSFTVEISKQSILDSEELSGAEMTLTVIDGTDGIYDDENDEWTAEKSWTSGKESEKFQLKPGTYELKETTAPDGHTVLQTTVTFTVHENGDIEVNDVTQKQPENDDTTLAYYDEESGKIVIKNELNVVEFSKKSVFGSESDGEIEGAKLTIKAVEDEDGNKGGISVYDDENGKWSDWNDDSVSWVSGTTAKRIGLKDGTYIITENVAPDHFNGADTEIRFVVKDGKVISVEVLTEDAKAQAKNGDYDLVIKDEPKQSFSKQEILDGKGVELEGAEMKIYSVDENANRSEKPVHSWKSTGKPEELSGDNLLKPGKYVLVEDTAPAGYDFAQDIYFEIDENGNIVLDGEKKDQIVMIDKLLEKVKPDDKTVSVTINKMDVANGEEVDGATITLIDENGEVVATWVSKKGETKTFEGIVPGKKYILRETITPDGYETAVDTIFIVKADEDGNALYDENGSLIIVIEGDDASIAEDGTIIINDTKKDIPTTSDSDTDSDTDSDIDSDTDSDTDSNNSSSSGNDSSSKSDSSSGSSSSGSSSNTNTNSGKGGSAASGGDSVPATGARAVAIPTLAIVSAGLVLAGKKRRKDEE